MGNEDDNFGTHILVSAASIRTIRNWLLGACFTIIVGLVGFIVERYYTGGEYPVLVQGQADNRQSLRALSQRTNELKNQCRASADAIKLHAESGCHAEVNRPVWGESR